MTLRLRPKIILKKLRIQNFGPFEKEHEILFSLEAEKNITLITGEQGSGKSTIFQMIYWLLFPEFETDKKENELKFLRSHHIFKAVNETKLNSINIGESFKVGGLLEFETVDKSNELKTFEIERYVEFIKTKNGLEYKEKTFDKSEIIKVYKDSSPIEDIDDFFNSIVSKYFPESVRDFVFIFGEGLTTILSESNIGKLKNFSLNISDYPKIKALTIYFERVCDYYTRQYNQLMAINQNLQERAKKIEDLKEERKGYQQQKKEIQGKLGELSNQITEWTKKISQVKEDIGFVRKYNQNNNDLRRYQKERKKIIVDRDKLLKRYLPIIYLEETMNGILEDISQKREDGIIPGKLTKEILTTIRTRPNTCVCGKEWDSTGDMIKNIDELISFSESSIIGEYAVKFETLVESKLKIVKDGKKEILLKHKEFIEKNKKINKTKGEIEKLKRDLTPEQQTEDWFVQIKKLEDKIEEGIKLKGSLEEKIKYTNELIESTTEDIKIQQLQYSKDTTSSKKKIKGSEDLERAKSLVEYYLKIIEEITDSVAEQIRLKCENETLKSMHLLTRRPENWSKINIIDEEKGWIIRAITSSGSTITNTSSGQTNILGISFISSLTNVLDIDLPLIFDSPFSNIDAITRTQVVENLSEMYNGKQIIFFVKDSNLLARQESNPADPNSEEIKDLLPQLEEKSGIKYLIQNPTEDAAILVRK